VGEVLHSWPAGRTKAEVEEGVCSAQYKAFLEHHGAAVTEPLNSEIDSESIRRLKDCDWYLDSSW